jgi:hypothetical protein
VSNAWRPEVGGYIFADAPNVVTSAAAIIRKVSTPRNTMQLRAIQLLRVSSPANGGFTIIARENSLRVLICPLQIRTSRSAARASSLGRLNVFLHAALKIAEIP